MLCVCWLKKQLFAIITQKGYDKWIFSSAFLGMVVLLMQVVYTRLLIPVYSSLMISQASPDLMVIWHLALFSFIPQVWIGIHVRALCSPLMSCELTLTLVFWKSFFTRSDVCFGSLSCWKTKRWLRPSFSTGWLKFSLTVSIKVLHTRLQQKATETVTVYINFLQVVLTIHPSRLKQFSSVCNLAVQSCSVIQWCYQVIQ